MPHLRHPALRPGQGTLTLTRMGNREALLAQSVGALSPSACGLCTKRKGPWTECVVAAGYLNDSCANCHYGAGGAKCSLRSSGKLKLLLYIFYSRIFLFHRFTLLCIFLRSFTVQS
jgi:hypothetical protein